MNILPVLLKDFYKVGHVFQYPKGTEMVYSNITPRGSRMPGVDEVVVFGVQYFVKEYLIDQFNKNFFGMGREEVLRLYSRRIGNALGPGVDVGHIAALWDLGYLPIEVKALPEGTLCGLRVPFLTIKNTLPEFFWLPNFFETIMSAVLWGAVNSATIAHEYRVMLDLAAARTGGDLAFVPWQGHDFSMRGMFGLEAALISGAGHLLSFTGTDTIPAIDFLEHYYNADSDRELVGGSVPASEHSVICAGGEESELETFRRLMVDVYPSGIVSIVSDTWDYWKVLNEILPALKSVILGRDGKVVIRPDSGDPVEIVCKSVPILWDIFGGTVNSKGYRQLDPHIGMIYGDSITQERCYNICKGLEVQGFASTNVVFGIGSYTYQYNTRDTFGMAMKATACRINGVDKEIFKDPKTDSGVKKSAKGLLAVVNGKLVDQCTPEQEAGGELRVVFRDGKLLVDDSLAAIRERLNASN